MPPEGVEKAPQTQDNPRVGAHLKQAGMQVGIDFTGKASRYPNTLGAHALLEHAKGMGGDTQDQLAEILFQAYFTDGVVPLGNALIDLAEKAGISRQVAKDIVKNENKLEEAHEASKNWTRKGVTGVPFFYFNGQRGFSGAQDVTNFVRMIELAAEKYPLEGQKVSGSL